MPPCVNSSLSILLGGTDEQIAYKIDSLPDVDFDIGEMYSGEWRTPYSNDVLLTLWSAGSIPIGTNASETLFFVFSPTIGKPVDEVTIW